MSLLSKASSNNWKEHRTAFKNLYRMTNWRDHREEIEEIYQQIYGQDINLTSELTLILDLESIKDIKFMQRVKDLRFPIYKRLQIHFPRNIISHQIETLTSFLDHFSLSSIRYVSFSSCRGKSKIDEFIPSFKMFLPKVTCELEIRNCNIGCETLQELIESAYNVKNLTLFNCNLEIDRTFIVSSDKKYNLTVLDLNWTYRNGAYGSLSKNKLEIFADALSETNIVDTLKFVVESNVSSAHSKEINRVFEERGFDVYPKY